MLKKTQASQGLEVPWRVQSVEYISEAWITSNASHGRAEDADTASRPRATDANGASGGDEVVIASKHIETTMGT